METNQEVTLTDVVQQKVERLLSESKVKDNQAMSEDDLKFVGALGWLSAAALTIVTIAANV